MNLNTFSTKDKISNENLKTDDNKVYGNIEHLKWLTTNGTKERINVTFTPGNKYSVSEKLSKSDLKRIERIKLRMLKDENKSDDRDSSSKRRNKEINNRKKSSRNNFWRRTKCDKCSETLAFIYCKECAERFCATCFAISHIKGEFRKHRPMPLSNACGKILNPAYILKPSDFTNLSNTCSCFKNLPKKPYISPPIKKKKKKKIVGKLSQNQDKESFNVKKNDYLSFANGTYDEKLSDQYFQDALLAWRRGEEPPYEPTLNPLLNLKNVSTESGIHARIPLVDKIQFTPTLSYLEQLLLKKHRICQLIPIEMKEILNILTLNNNDELMENEKLLQANFLLEMSALNHEMASDTCNVNIVSLAEQWSDAVFVSGRLKHNDDKPLFSFECEINEIISSLDNCPKEVLVNNEMKLEHGPNGILQYGVDPYFYNKKDHREEDVLHLNLIPPYIEPPKMKPIIINQHDTIRAFNEVTAKIVKGSNHAKKEENLIDARKRKSSHDSSHPSEDTMANVQSNPDSLFSVKHLENPENYQKE